LAKLLVLLKKFFVDLLFDVIEVIVFT
jgi:hypothetical protein